MRTIEKRTFPMARWTQRAGDYSPMKKWTGHAAVFNSVTQIGGFREVVAPGAFKEAIAGDDVRALFNHDPNLILGRNRAYPRPTLRLAEDTIGLFIEIDPPDTTYARDLGVSIGRGDVSQMSFSFAIPEGGEVWDFTNKENPLRTIIKARLFDISPVTYPAYRTTDISANSESAPNLKRIHQARRRRLQLAMLGCRGLVPA